MQFTPFLTLLAEIEDPRRAEGKLYRLPHVVLFAILAMVAGANSYRSIHSFIDVRPTGLSTLRGIDFGIGVAPLSERRVWRDCAKKCNAAGPRKLVETAPLGQPSPPFRGNCAYKTVPCGLRGAAHRLPPCASTIDWQIDRPIPMP